MRKATVGTRQQHRCSSALFNGYATTDEEYDEYHNSFKIMKSLTDVVLNSLDGIQSVCGWYQKNDIYIYVKYEER